MKKALLGTAVLVSGLFLFCMNVHAAGFTEVGEYGRPGILVIEDSEE